ncbi:metallophosphoesterase [Tsukamurella sp. 8F]|uniref:metallophosphoesterase n=1 Tax=unclassified Tsukamurella TaxID=2633480 RepID=UPI0023B90099|nr:MULTISPECIES: metallophosphoesterase [unclassified Tsukamurella]MDF0531341.1 metallophosphoesterase [Tsukamurella sp. 8J]MDF0588547.1 metallophosphoesterase [Tsukamurella sp. 8F]
MARILILALVFALLSWWLHRRLVRATDLRRGWRIAAALVVVAGGVLTVIGAGSGSVFAPAWARLPAFAGWVWAGTVFYLVLGLLPLAVLCVVAAVVRRIRKRERRSRRAVRIATAAVVLAACGTAGYGVTAAASPSIVGVRIPLDRLPPGFDGVRIAFVSDLHVGPSRGAGFTQKVADLVAAQHPDLIAFGGDLTDGTVDRVGDTLKPLAPLRAPLGVFGVSGNHEFYSDDAGRWLDAWQRVGIRPLRNARVSLVRNGSRIDLAGIHDYSGRSPNAPDLKAALAGHDPRAFTLLLAHEPRQALATNRRGAGPVDLQLSGHTHGGQLWPLRYLVPLQQPSVEGLAWVDGTAVYTTRGVGAWGPPMRVGAPPEITLLTLVRTAATRK